MRDLVTSPHVTYRDGLARGVLLFQRCAACSAAIFPPRVACPSCGGAELGTEESRGYGEVYSTTAVAAKDGPPYAVCLIDLDEGFRMMSTVTDVPADDVTIGSRVTLVVEDGDPPRPTFVRVAGR
jgi:uncharacterized OB-fold protein